MAQELDHSACDPFIVNHASIELGPSYTKRQSWTLQQLCDDASDIVLIDNNGVTL